MYKVIICEDEPNILNGLIAAVSWKSYDMEVVAACSNGQDGLEAIKTLNPHLVITDVKMPFVDGIGLIEQTAQFSPHIKFIIISAFEEFEYAKRAISLGVLNYISKLNLLPELNAALKNFTLLSEDAQEKTRTKIFEKLIYQHLVGQELLDEESAYDNTFFHVFGIYNHDEIACDFVQFVKTQNNFHNLNFLTLLLRKNLCIIIAYDYGVDTGIEEFTKNLSSFANAHNNIVISGSRKPSLKHCLHSIDKIQLLLARKKTFDKSTLFLSLDDYDNNNVSEDIEQFSAISANIIISIENHNLQLLKTQLNEFVLQLFGYSSNITNMQKNAIWYFSIFLWKAEEIYGQSESLLKLKNQTGDLIYHKEKDILEQSIKNLKHEFCEYMECWTRTKNNDDYLEIAKRYIDNHLTQKISLKSIAFISYMTPTYFSKLFKEKYGETFSNYVNRQKMSIAKEMLSKGETVSNVAHTLGYEEIKNFREMFKKHIGKLPSEI